MFLYQRPVQVTPINKFADVREKIIPAKRVRKLQREGAERKAIHKAHAAAQVSQFMSDPDVAETTQEIRTALRGKSATEFLEAYE